ncbi:nitrilase-related carbon-nitrogen hydrolase [Pseudomonas syringae]|nr:carbon-nitrogen hydrolase family protein [Pseudomonas syringae]
MRKIFGLGLVVLVAAVLLSYGVWTTQRPLGHYLSDLRIELVASDGVPAGRGNLLGIEARLYPTDYQDLNRLHRKLAAWLQQARDQGLLNDKTLVVLPEHIGTWLYAAGEKNQFYQADTVGQAMQWLAWSNPVQFVRAMAQAEGQPLLADAYLRMKASRMAHDYQQVFGGLAREFGVTLVAGSVVLPDPRIEDGQLHIGSGPLYNASVVFAADGRPLGQPQRQMAPDNHQRRYIKAADPADLHVFDTPAGRLGVLIGSDSLHADYYARLNDQAVQLIAVPAFLPNRQRWNQPWRDRRGVDLPAGSLTEAQAWQHLTLTGQAPRSTARAGISVFMQGQFWDQSSAGESFNHGHQAVPAAPPGEPPAGGARMINLWL